jgi:LuxR family maltose regulon positive regulatory protein
MTRLIKVHFATGHVAEVLLWMDWLERNTPLDEHPDLAAYGALVHIQEGNVLEAEKWLDAATRGNASKDASAVVWLVTASTSSFGVEQMLSDIETAREIAGPGSAWLPAIIVTKGLAHVMEGRPDLAEPCFVEAAQLGLENHSFAAAVLALGQRAMLAIERQDWNLASDLADLAMAIIDEQGLDGYHISGLPLIAAARCARRKNDIPKTQSLLARASLVRPRLSSAIPGESVEILIEMAKAYVELSDVVGARALIREADDIVLIRPNLGVFPARLEELKASLADLGPGTVGLSALTRAELRLLPFLATNLSFPEIGEQLFISRHTVKTQAMSIYRKLGTSSRSEAVAKAHEVGLLQR